MNRLSPERRATVVRCLVEGNSIRATVRITGAAKNTVVKLLVELGRACSAYQDKVLRDLPCKRIQCDEIWSFIGCKEKNLPEEVGSGPHKDSSARALGRLHGRGPVFILPAHAYSTLTELLEVHHLSPARHDQAEDQQQHGYDNLFLRRGTPSSEAAT